MLRRLLGQDRISTPFALHIVVTTIVGSLLTSASVGRPGAPATGRPPPVAGLSPAGQGSDDLCLAGHLPRQHGITSISMRMATVPGMRNRCWMRPPTGSYADRIVRRCYPHSVARVGEQEDRTRTVSSGLWGQEPRVPVRIPRALAMRTEELGDHLGRSVYDEVKPRSSVPGTGRAIGGAYPSAAGDMVISSG